MDIFGMLFITQFLAMMSPGPDMLLVTKNALGYKGFHPALGVSLGIAAGLIFHFTLSIGGLAVLIKSERMLYLGVRYIGAIYLIYLGIRSLLSQATISSPDIDAHKDQRNQFCKAFRQGFLTNITNPKVTLYVISLFSCLIPEHISTGEKLIYAGFLVIEALVVWSAFAAIIKWILPRKGITTAGPWFNRLFGVLLLLLGISVFWVT